MGNLIFSKRYICNRTEIKIFGIKIKYKNKLLISKNNHIFLKKNNKLFPVKKAIKGLYLCVNGSNNKIIIEYPTFISKTVIHIEGSNNKIHIGKQKFMHNSMIKIEGNGSIVAIGSSIYDIMNCNIDLTTPSRGARVVRIGKNAYIGGVSILGWANNSKILIGEDCLFSWCISIMSGDAHTITTSSSSERINIGKSVIIGNHVWLGQNVFIGKNVQISDNCIVGAHSVVTKTYNETNTIIAGNPAKIVKKDICWDRKD